jgi:nucleoside-diphosphate-sugar epimerase
MLSLVTGATGFIGSHLVDALVLRGETVRALVRPTSRTRALRDMGVELRVGTLADNATLMAAAKGVDRIYHCAGMVADWGLLEDFTQANVNGVHNLLAAATRNNVAKFIHLSTSDVYGFPSSPPSESEAPSPRGYPYADSKIEGESLVWRIYRDVKLPVTVLRPALVYGPRCRLFVTTMVQALRRRQAPLVDEGRHLAGMTYVGNLVDALILAADSPASVGQAYNVADDNQVTWREYMDALADLAEVPRPTRSYGRGMAFALAALGEGYYRMIGSTQRPLLTRMLVELLSSDQQLPIDKARRELGYRPRVGFAEGMRHTGDWLRREGLLD